MPLVLTDREHRHRAAIVRASRIGGSLARMIRDALQASVAGIPERVGPHDMLAVRSHVETVLAGLQKRLGERFRKLLMAAAEREYYLTAVELTRASRGTQEDIRDWLNLIVPAPALSFLERIVGPLWQRVIGAINPGRASTTILQGIAAGSDRRQITAELTDVFDGYASAARRVARTAGLQVATQSQLSVSEQIPDLVVGYELNTVLDDRVRPEHRARHGFRYYRNPKRNQRPLSDCPQPPVWDGQVAWNCLLPNELVSGRVVRGFKAYYSGKVVEVLSTSGVSLRVTANHPILTPNGFVAAHSLREGDHVLCHMPNLDGTAYDEAHSPPTAQELFRSLSETAGVVPADPLALDFDGDAEFFQGNVDVTAFVGELHNGGIPGRYKGSTHFKLSSPDQVLTHGTGFRPFSEGIGGVSLPAAGGVSHGDLAGALRGVHGRPLQPLRLGPAADVDTMANKVSGQPEPLLLRGVVPAARNSKFVAELLQRHAGQVAIDNVVRVREFHWAGHVYDFETDVGYFAAGSGNQVYHSMWVGNCRCFLVPIIEIDGEEV